MGRAPPRAPPLPLPAPLPFGPPRQYSLVEIADFCGVGPATVLRIEERALKKMGKKVVR